MKYNIFINQVAAVENDFEVDIVDLAIFDFIKDFINSKKCVRINVEGENYYWISHKCIIENLPLLRIKTNQGIINRIENLIKCNLIIKSSESQSIGKTLYKLGDNYEKMIFSGPKQNNTPINENLDPPQQDFKAPLNKTLEDNNIINSKIKKDSSESDKTSFTGSLFSDDKIEKKEKETLFRNSDVFDFNIFSSKFGKDFDAIDLNYYYQSVYDWSETKEKIKRSARGWVATARKFMRSDKEKGRLKFKSEASGQSIEFNDAMDFLNGNF